jgi:hypothetical protein
MRVLLGLTSLALVAGCYVPPTPMAWTLDDLSAADGFQIRIPTFDVPAGHEEQSCYFMRVPDLAGGADFWVHRVLMATSQGSHHLNVFRVRTIVGLDPTAGTPIKLGPYDATVIYGHDDYQNSPCWESANWADWPLVANTESPLGAGPYTDWTLPDQVALRFTPGEMLMIQPHYVNTAVQPTPIDAEVGINFYRSQLDQPIELGTLFATQQSIRICESNPTPIFSGTCRMPSAVTVTAANGHFHSRGREFSMYVWDGTSIDQPADTDRFYDSLYWNSPPMATGLDRPIAAGGGIWWDCAYQWKPPASGCDAVNAKDPEQAGDCCYVFGGNTDVGEHCNAFVYYYPKLTTDVFCN